MASVLTNKNKKQLFFIEKFYGVLGFLGVYFLCVSVVCPAIAASNGGIALLFALGTLILMLFGYFMQDVWCRARGFKKGVSSRGYEAEVKFYDFKKAFPVLLVGGVVGYIAARITDAKLREMSFEKGNYYDEGTLWPLFAAALVISVIMMGSFIWFYPYDRLLTGKAFFVGLAIFIMTAVLYFVVGSFVASTGVTVAICLFGYGMCALLIFNQQAMTRTYRGTVVEFLTPAARFYNMSLALLLALIFLILAGLLFIIVKGASVFFMLLLSILLTSAGAGKNDTELSDADEMAANINEVVFKNKEPSRSADFWMMLGFFLIVGIILFFSVARRRESIRHLLTRLRNWIYALYDSIFGPIRNFMSHGFGFDDEEEILNYIDEEKRLHQNAKIREYQNDGKRRRTWHEFQYELRQCKTEEEKYRCAYSEFVRIYRRNISVSKTSDTAREIAEKYTRGRKYGYESLDEITDDFEKIAYGFGTADGDAQIKFEKLLAIVKNGFE